MRAAKAAFKVLLTDAPKGYCELTLTYGIAIFRQYFVCMLAISVALPGYLTEYYRSNIGYGIQFSFLSFFFFSLASRLKETRRLRIENTRNASVSAYRRVVLVRG